MPRTYQFVIGVAEAGSRLDRYLTHHLPAAVSRAMIQRTIRDGKVTVGERPAKVHQKLRQGDVVAARFDQLGARSRGTDLIPQKMALEIVHEDDTLLVVNKPAGLVTHPAPGHWDGTLVNAILWHLRKGQGAGDEGQGKAVPRAPSSTPRLLRAGIVHRLDKDTSGLLLVAKTEAAHVALARQLKARTIHRRYLALVEGHLPLDAGTVNVPLGRHLTHRKEMTIRHLGGRQAVTHYRVMKRFEAAAMPATLVELSLETGRTHQIRVHLAHLGYPVMGDTTYGKRPAPAWREAGVPRHLLHAYHLSFQHPTTGRSMSVAAPIPEDINRWITGDVSIFPSGHWGGEK